MKTELQKAIDTWEYMLKNEAGTLSKGMEELIKVTVKYLRMVGAGD